MLCFRLVRYRREFLNSTIFQERRTLLSNAYSNFIANCLIRNFGFIAYRQNLNFCVKSMKGSKRRKDDGNIPLYFHQGAAAMKESKNKKENVEEFNVTQFLNLGRKEFEAVYPLIVKDMMFNDFVDNSIKDALDWQRKVMDYNVPHGKKNRGVVVLSSYKLLTNHTDLTEDNLKLASILGWCVEMAHAYLIVLDDIMDQSSTRRGMPCWYKVDGVGLTALNDAVLVENGIYFLLKKHFSKLSCYVDILETFHQIIRCTSFGQCLDMMSTPSGERPKFELFTDDRYSAIAKYKTSYYSFLLPVKLALCLAGWKDQNVFNKAEEILLKIGHLFQVQDDYLDCFGDAKVMGKQGTDIQDGKCSWLIVSALKQASEKQRDILMNHYGCHNELSVKKIKDIYDELELKSSYAQFEENMFQELRSLIDDITASYDLPPELFYFIMITIHKRKS